MLGLALPVFTALASVGANTALALNPTILPGGDKVFCDTGRFLNKVPAWGKDTISLIADNALTTAFSPRDPVTRDYLDEGVEQKLADNNTRLRRIGVNTRDALYMFSSALKPVLGGALGAGLALPLAVATPWAIPLVALGGFAGSALFAKDALLANATYTAAKIAPSNGMAQSSFFYPALLKVSATSEGNAFDLSGLSQVPVSQIEGHVESYLSEHKAAFEESINGIENSLSQTLLMRPFAPIVAGTLKGGLNLMTAA